MAGLFVCTAHSPKTACIAAALFALLALRLLHQGKPRHDHARHKEKQQQQQDESHLHAFILNRALCVAKLVLHHMLCQV